MPYQQQALVQKPEFLDDAMLEAMSLDALKNSHPINVNVNHPAQIREIFDAISYDKGGSVLRMLENYVGIENFRKGLKHYLTLHKYSNAEGRDLWNSIGKVARKPVDAMMKTWIDQVGYPVVDVKRNNSKLSYGNLKLFIDKISRQLAGNEISNKDDFDFHASSIVKLLGMRKSLNAAQNIISAEIKHILNYSTTR